MRQQAITIKEVLVATIVSEKTKEEMHNKVSLAFDTTDTALAEGIITKEEYREINGELYDVKRDIAELHIRNQIRTSGAVR